MDQDKFCDIGDVEELAASGIDLSTPPTSGELYLRQVIVGRTKCETTVVSDRDFTHYSAKRTVQIPMELLDNVPQATNFPPKSWRRMQVNEFERLRTELAKRRSAILNKVESKIKFPRAGDEVAWKKFCFETSSPPLKDSVGEKSDILKCHSGTPPLLTIVASLSPARALDLFEFQVSWFAEDGFSRDRMHWLYALMLLIDTPLTPEASSALRDLAREFAKMRRSISADDQSDQNETFMRAYYLFLCLIVDYFGQRDLAEW